ncbi:MAG TPA: hypothetical protein VFG81_14105 [Anaerolineales bacterium]|jgi:hypothetical protein|nr:hypothetical protein [Anaerolineales bacterium]
MPAQVRLFFISLLQVILLTAVMVGLVFMSIPPDPNHYFAGSLIQLELLKNTPSPRIILIGGSNVSFGLDAELMQRKLSIPVINDGLHAGLGIVPLRELEEYLRPGDVVIISLEYQVFSSRDVMEGDLTFLSDWIEYAPGRIKYLSDPWRDIPAIYLTMLQRKVNRQVNTVLYGGSLNEVRDVFVGTRYNSNGDFIGHLKQASTPPRKISFEPYPVSSVQPDIFTFLEQFHQFARQKGAAVYFEAPASRRINCENTGEASLTNFFKTFEDRSAIPVLTQLEDLCLPDKYFFDTAYHLNAEGRRLRTERLIEKWLQLTASQ